MVVPIYGRGVEVLVPLLVVLERAGVGLVVQRRAGGSGIRPVLLYAARHRVDPAGRDDVVRERGAAVGAVRVAHRREGIVDGDAALGEVAGDLARGGRPHHGIVDGLGLVAFDRRPEERLVLHDRAAERARVYVGVRGRLVA